MSQEKIKSENEENENIEEIKDDVQISDGVDGVRLTVKKKRFKKFDVLVFGVCIVASVLIWLYASNLEKKAAENDRKGAENKRLFLFVFFFENKGKTVCQGLKKSGKFGILL